MRANRYRFPLAVNCVEIRFLAVTFVVALGIAAQAQTKPNLPSKRRPGTMQIVQPDLLHFSAELDSIRVALRIPGMATAIMIGDSVVFEEGLGYADLANHVKVTPRTVFRIASITKTFTSTLVMQLVEQGKLNLQTPVSVYGLDFGNPRITVKNLLTHTSEEEPGTYYQYNGFRYGRLTPVIEKSGGVPYYQLLMENIIKPLGMVSTAPGDSIEHYASYLQNHRDMAPYFENAHRNLTKPYLLNEKREVVEANYLDEFGAFGGLATTVTDLLKYSLAIDRNQFVSAATQKEIFTPNRTRNGSLTPYGLGWFTETYRGVDFYWHYGQTSPGESGLFVKIPSRKMTFVVLCNTDQLSWNFPLGDGDLLVSPVGQLLYKYCINEDSRLARINYHLPIGDIRPEITSARYNAYADFYKRELVTQATMLILNGDTAKARQFYILYSRLNKADGNPDHSRTKTPPSGHEIAAIRNAGVSQVITRPFMLTKPTRVLIEGVGENCSGDFSSWCDYGWIEDSTGKMIWQMQGKPAEHAGGAKKNQRVRATIDLPAGSYRLRYTSDRAHAYNSWDSAPPDDLSFWGIVLLIISQTPASGIRP